MQFNSLDKRLAFLATFISATAERTGSTEYYVLSAAVIV